MGGRGHGVEVGSTADEASGGTRGKLCRIPKDNARGRQREGKEKEDFSELGAGFCLIVGEKDQSPLITSA